MATRKAGLVKTLTDNPVLAIGGGVALLGVASLYVRPAIAWREGKIVGPILLRYVGNAPAESGGHRVYLSFDVAGRFSAMQKAAAAENIVLRPVSGYRSFEKQTVLFAEAVIRGGLQMPKLDLIKTLLTKGFVAPSTWKAIANPQTSLPGYSNHQDGDAVDIAMGATIAELTAGRVTKELIWVRNNAAKFGLYNNLPRDLVHWSKTGY